MKSKDHSIAIPEINGRNCCNGGRFDRNCFTRLK